MKSLARSLRIGGSVQRLVNADAALWACTGAPTEYRRRFQHEAATAAWANEAIAEYANDADQEKAEDGHPKVVVNPGGGSPASSKYADRYQADPEKPIPPAQLVPDRHRLSTVFRTVHRFVQTHAAIGAVLDLRTGQPERRRHRNGLAESSTALQAADEQERDDRSHKAEHADEGKVTGSRSSEAHIARERDEQPRDDGEAKSPSHSALDVVADRHLSFPRRSTHRFAEAQSAARTTPRLLRLIARRQDRSESEKSTASGATNGANVGQVDNAAQEPRA
jgi:hypothetical protein